MATMIVKVVEVYETIVKVDADLPPGYRRERAYARAAQASSKKIKTKMLYLEPGETRTFGDIKHDS